MKIRRFVTVLAAALAVMAMSVTAYAGGWVSDANGWWYDNGNGTWPALCWQWIDGNNDGIAECYYFNQNGYLVTNSVVDGSEVNADGQWVSNGLVQVKSVNPAANSSAIVASGFNGTYVTAGSSSKSGSGSKSYDSIEGTYEGYYTAPQGKTGVTIDIYEDEAGEFWGEYDFYNLPNQNNAKEGSYAIRVIANNDGTYNLKQDHWIDQPSGYAMFSWNKVKISKSGTMTADSGNMILRCHRQ